MARGECRQSTTRPALGQLRAMHYEGMKEKQRDGEEYSSDQSKAEKGQGIAKNQPSLQAPIILCFQGHKSLRRSVLLKSTYPAYGYDADRNTSAGCRLFQAKAARLREASEKQIRSSGQGLDWIGPRFPAGRL